MFVREWGSGERYVLLLHGLSGSSLIWHNLGEDLAILGYHVLAPDLSGHGLSERDATGYSVEKWSNEVIALQLPTPELLIGHSIGGLIAAKISDEIQADKLILLDPVLRLPKKGFLLWGVQYGFSHAMRRRLRLKLVNKSWDVRDAEIERINLSRWDWQTSKALKVNKKEIFGLFNRASPTLLIRAKRSYIVPASFAKRNLHESIQHFYFQKAGHNIHCESYNDLFALITNFISINEKVPA